MCIITRAKKVATALSLITLIAGPVQLKAGPGNPAVGTPNTGLPSSGNFNSQTSSVTNYSPTNFATNGRSRPFGVPTNGIAGVGGNLTNSLRTNTNFFQAEGTNGLYRLGTNGNFRRGTNGFFRWNGRSNEFIPDRGDLYERGPDGIYRRNTDDSRGVYRNGVLYSPKNGIRGTNGVLGNNGVLGTNGTLGSNGVINP